MFCSKCGAAMAEDMKACPNCGAPQLGMKWFKFLIYFSLWAGAVINLISAISGLTGSTYNAAGLDPEVVYSTFRGLKTVDVLYGIVGLATAALAVYTRFRLARFRVNGPMCLYILYCLPLVSSFIYMAAAGSILGVPIFDGEYMGQIAGNVVMLIINIVYFRKRKALFIN